MWGPEEASRDSERRYRLLLDHLPDILVVKSDMALVCKFVGGGGVADIGVDPAVFVGRPLWDVYEPCGGSRERLLECHRTALAGQAGKLELHSALTGKDYETTVSPLVGDDERIVGTMLVATDVSARLANQREARRLAQMVATSGEAIMSY